MFFQRPKINFEHGARNTVSFLLSMTVHVVLLLVLACWAVVAGRSTNGIMLISANGDNVDTVLNLAPAPSASESSIDASSTEEALFKQSEFEYKLDSDLMLPPGSTEASAVAASLTSTGIKAISDGLDTRGLGRGASFFGTYAQGGRFVYVIDSSKSMKGDRWIIARQKLLESLKSLGREQEFFVICFDEQTSLMFNCAPEAMEFKRVNDMIIERVSRWLRSRTLGPNTMPAEALQYALAMQPDAIFVLSDGELQDNTLQILRMTNITAGSKKQIPIHAVHLISEQGMETLRQLAEDNGGTFRHISR